MSKHNIQQHREVDILFYDSSCPLCAKEIRWLKQYQSGDLRCEDIHSFDQQAKGLLPTNITEKKQAMLKILHLLGANGQWLTGLDATVHAWSHTRFGFLLKPLRWPIIKPIADTLYLKWAERRYERRYQCDVCYQETD